MSLFFHPYLIVFGLIVCVLVCVWERDGHPGRWVLAVGMQKLGEGAVYWLAHVFV